MSSDDDDFIWPYSQGKVIFICLCVFSAVCCPILAFCCYSAAKDRDPRWMKTGALSQFTKCCRHSPNDRLYCAVPGIILVISGFATLAAWCSQSEIIQDHEYHGPMQVWDSRVKYPVQDNAYTYEYNCRQVSYQCGTSEKRKTCYREECDTAYYEAIAAYIEVGWGGSWGCPEHQDKICTSEERVHQCTSRICASRTHAGEECSPDQRSAAADSARECLAQRYNSGAAIPETSFDVGLSPTDELSFQAVWTDLYGDCDVCSAEFTMPHGAARRNRVAGFIVLYVGLVLTVAFLMKNGGFGMLCGWEGEMPWPIWMEAPGKWERFIRPQKFNAGVDRNGGEYMKEQDIEVTLS